MMGRRPSPYSFLVSNPDALRTVYGLAKGRGLVINYSKDQIEESFTRPFFPRSLQNFTNILRTISDRPGLHLTHSEYVVPPKAFGECGTRRAFHFFLDVDGRGSIEPARRVIAMMARELGRLDVPHWLKYSGQNGFHLHIPSSAFPPSIDGNGFLELAPDLFLDIKHHLVRTASNECPSDLFRTIIHPKRYYYTSQGIQRLPFSLHENTGRLSLPISGEEIWSFEPREAEMRGDLDLDQHLAILNPRGGSMDELLSLLEEERGKPVPFYHRR